MGFDLDYERLVYLDAEDLAEDGIGEAYERLLPELQRYLLQPARVEEVLDKDKAIYSVRCGGKEYAIYGLGLSEDGGGSWGRATVAFFALVNGQLAHSEFRFYAISGGNDLGGMFLTPAQSLEARTSLPSSTDWPYFPKDEPPW
ncbi:MAG: hypothetical protein QM703_10490 [Gemmatales bacterium]